MSQIDFLSPGLKQIKQSIKDIDSSYNHDWDLLAELCQNAVDAIKVSNNQNGQIDLTIDATKKMVQVADNGCGINPDDAEDLLKPFSTNKTNQEESIGEKGVGLTFVMFSSNKFEIESGNDNGFFRAQIIDAANWKNSSDMNKHLFMNIDKNDQGKKGTTVKVEDIVADQLFKLTFAQLKFILRTKTAIGNTLCLWGNESKSIVINLFFRDQNGLVFEEVLPFKFLLPFDGLDQKHEVEDLDEFIAFANSAAKTDLEKRKRLANKVIVRKGKFVHNDQRIINYVACFVPKRSVWGMLSIREKLCTEDQLENPDWLDSFGYSLFEHGIYTSVKGMPTGISIDHPTTGYSGYWSNFFILFEDKNLSFDIGRKAIHGMQARIYKEYSKQIFNDYLQYVTKYVSGEIKETTEWDKEEIFAEIDKILDLNTNKVNFKKSPKDQEASVAAVFFECIGNGLIKDITPLHSGYRGRYDLYAKFGSKRIVIEFKAKLKNILKDFTDEVKLFDEIDCIVCWDVIEDDLQALANRGISCEKVMPSGLLGLQTQSSKQIPHATHVLGLSGLTNPVYVIDLKKLLLEI